MKLWTDQWRGLGCRNISNQVSITASTIQKELNKTVISRRTKHPAVCLAIISHVWDPNRHLLGVRPDGRPGGRPGAPPRGGRPGARRSVGSHRKALPGREGHDNLGCHHGVTGWMVSCCWFSYCTWQKHCHKWCSKTKMKQVGAYNWQIAISCPICSMYAIYIW
jgi:hypothetical protein